MCTASTTTAGNPPDQLVLGQTTDSDNSAKLIVLFSCTYVHVRTCVRWVWAGRPGHFSHVTLRLLKLINCYFYYCVRIHAHTRACDSYTKYQGAIINTLRRKIIIINFACYNTDQACMSWQTNSQCTISSVWT